MSSPVHVELGEHQRRTVAAPGPNPVDERLVSQLGTGEGPSARLDVRWLANGQVELQASSWVGVVHFSTLHVSVVPKLVGGSLQVLRMLQYAAGVDVLSRLPADRPLETDGSDLFDLICLLLTEEAQAVSRDGLLGDYRPVSDTVDALRGRLQYREQFLREFGQLTRLHCDYDEYDADIPENQLIAAALTVARQRASDRGIRFAALRLATIFDEACSPPTRRADHYRRALSYDRRNERYRPAHELALLVLKCSAFDDFFDASGTRVSAFMLNMDSVFERFVSRLAAEALDGEPQFEAATQYRLGATIRNDDTGRTYTTMRPDLVVKDQRSERRVPIDVKYKLYSDRKLAAGDIYQAFMYAFALGDGEIRRAGLIYPATAGRSGPSLSIRPLDGPVAARITGLGIDVPALLDELLGPHHDRAVARFRDALLSLAGFEAPTMTSVR